MPSYVEWTDDERRELAEAVKKVRAEQPLLSPAKTIRHAMTLAMAPDRRRPLVSSVQLYPWLDRLLEEIGDRPICRVPQRRVPRVAPTPAQADHPDLDRVFAQIKANNDGLVNAVSLLHAAVSRLTGEVHLLKRHLRAGGPTAGTRPSVLVVGYSDQRQKETITRACGHRARVRFMDMDHPEDDPRDDWVIGTQWTPKKWWDNAHDNLDPTSMVFVPGDAQDIVKQIFELVGG